MPWLNPERVYTNISSNNTEMYVLHVYFTTVLRAYIVEKDGVFLIHRAKDDFKNMGEHTTLEAAKLAVELST